MASLLDLQHRALRELIGNRCHSQSTLAINAGSAATLKTTVVPSGGIIYTIGGKTYTKANLSAQALTALAALQNPVTGQDGFYVQPDLTTVYYVVVLNAAGTVYTIQGTYTGQTLANYRARLGDSTIPDIAVPDLYCPIGYIKVVTNGATFTPATTALDAANITFTFVDVAVLPNSLTP